MVKSGRTENLLDVQMQYKILGFCRLSLNRRKLYRTKTWYTLPAHGGKRQSMAPGGQFMAENDPSSLKLRRTGKMEEHRDDSRNSAETTGERCGRID